MILLFFITFFIAAFAAGKNQRPVDIFSVIATLRFAAISALAALPVLIAFAPPLRSWRSHHFAMALFIAGAIVVFNFMLAESVRFVARFEPRLEQLNRQGPA